MRKILLNIIIISSIFAGTTGKIRGIILDSTTNEPLIGCNVYLNSTSYGASSDLDGSFILLNIPPGEYDLIVSMIGYDQYKVLNLEVNIDLTTTINVALNESSLELESVVVNSSKKLINKNLTATTAIVTSKTISKLPVNEVSEILNLQAGFVDGHLRGGRSSEVAYWVDGMPMTDGYDGTTVVDINKEAIREMQLISGAFNAEYGQAMSGVVNITTNEGSNKFGGSFDTYFGDYISNHSSLFRNIDNIDLLTTKNVNLNLHGSLIKNKLFYYLSSRYVYFQGVHEGIRVYNPYSYGVQLVDQDTDEYFWHVLGSNEYFDEQYNTYNCFNNNECDEENPDVALNQLRHAHTTKNPLGDRKYVPMEWNLKKYLQMNIIWKPSQTSKIKISQFEDDVDFQEYNRFYQLNPDGDLLRYRSGKTSLFQYNYTINKNSFFSLGLIDYKKSYHHMPFEDKDEYVHVDLNNQATPSYSFSTGGSEQNFFKRYTNTKTAKFDYVNQINKFHQLKMGVEYKKHSIYYENITLQYDVEEGFDPKYNNPFVVPSIADISSVNTSIYDFNPEEASFYIQDKLELDDMIVNFGIRYDYFDPKGLILSDPSDPFIYSPLKDEHKFDCSNFDGICGDNEDEQSVEDRLQYWYLPTSAKSMISPRIGASFPLSDRGVFHFSYGHFFQMPQFQLLYHNSDITLDRYGTGNIGVIGNPDLKPEKTISYEIGIQYKIAHSSAVDMTMYFRDIRDLTGTRSEVIRTYSQQEYNKYQNTDFAFIKGLVLSYKKDFNNGFSTTFDFTLQQAKGTASEPSDAYNANINGALPEIHMIPLDWDQRYTLNVTLYYDSKLGGVGLISKWGSGQPYTPFVNDNFSNLIQNSKSKPTTFNVDLKTYFIISKLNNSKIYINIFNVFDHLNHINVYDDTGVADSTLDEQRALSEQTNQLINSIEKYFENETFYSSPRRLEIGFRYEF